jgi:predicted anti-sigma-YlaC factor YlaD
MTCEQAIALLADYLEMVLEPRSLMQELEAHLEGCEACRAYLATYRRTRDLAAQAQHVEMPEEMKTRLRAFLLAKLREQTR